MTDFSDRKAFIKKAFDENGIMYTDVQIDGLYTFYDMLIEKNKVMNLTAITDFEEVVYKHFTDSLLICRSVALKDQRVIDVGTGAGFPGIPLKIMYPGLKITLLDSLNKRLDFLNEVISELKLKDIITVHGRAEELSRKAEYRERYDIAVSRAVANLSTLVEYVLPFVSVKGSFVAYKAGKAQEELSAAENAIKILGGKVLSVDNFDVAGSDIERTLINIGKIKTTPDKYPRGGGKPLKAPLS